MCLLTKPRQLYNVFERELQMKSGKIYLEAGGRLNKKDGLTRYGDSHVKDKTS